MERTADKKSFIELTAAIGSPTQLEAAVNAGANALCLRIRQEDDRKTTGAFSPAELRDAVRYCRVRDVKVYISFERHYLDGELDSLLAELREAGSCGVDAVRFSDMGAARMAAQVLPETKLHISDGLCLENEMSGFLAAKQGYDRVCLGPGASLAKLRPQDGVEFEVTGMNLGCSALAGMCALATFPTGVRLTGELCPGPCREAHSGTGSKDHVLCPRPVCLIEELPALREAGAAAVYIECRELTPRQTEGIVALWRQAIDDRPPQSALRKIASVLGTKEPGIGFLRGETAEALFAKEPPYRRTPSLLETVIKSRTDPYSPSEDKKIDVAFHLRASSGRPLTVTVMDSSGNVACTEGPVVENNGASSRDDASLRTVLCRTGDAPYNCIGVKMSIERGCFVDPFELAKLRDRATMQLTALRGNSRQSVIGSFEPEETVAASGQPKLAVELTDRSQLSAELAGLAVDLIYLPLGEITSKARQYRSFAERTGAEICPVMPKAPTADMLHHLRAQLDLAREQGISNVLCGDLGSAALALREGFKPRGDWSLWTGNSLTVKALSDFGFISTVISLETPFTQIGSLSHDTALELFAYGRAPLMVLPVCPFAKESCPTGKCTVKDARHVPYPVIKDPSGCRCTMYDNKKLAAGTREELSALGPDIIRLRFVGENQRECALLTSRFLNNELIVPNDMTSGHYVQKQRGLLKRPQRGTV